MIKSFRHSGLERFFLSGSKAGIQPEHAAKLSVRLGALNLAKSPDDLRRPGWELHSLAGSLASHWSIKVSANWRVTFLFEEEDVVLIDYQDYH
jgi:proteic killer suppression protein